MVSILHLTIMWPLQLLGGGDAPGEEVEVDQFQGAGEVDQRHDSFDQPPTYNQKWEEEDDWETEQREEDGTQFWGIRSFVTVLKLDWYAETLLV